jgi:hypothetical protein
MASPANDSPMPKALKWLGNCSDIWKVHVHQQVLIDEEESSSHDALTVPH